MSSATSAVEQPVPAPGTAATSPASLKSSVLPGVSVPSTAPPLLAALFRGLGDPARLSCLFALRERARTVGEVVAATGLSQPNVSKHLACLRDCGLAQAEKSGRYVTYCLCGTGVEELLQAAEALLARAGEGLASCPVYQTDRFADAAESAKSLTSEADERGEQREREA